MMKNKNSIFTVTPFLVTIDGPDGAGKSIFSEILTQGLKRNNPYTSLVRPTRFDASLESQKIESELQKVLKRIKLHSKAHNRFFLRTAKTNYQNLIVPAVQSKQLVIADSSEIRALAFILEKGTTAAKRDTITQISKGILTCGIKPAKRIILYAEPEELYKNLSTKEELDVGDPRNLDEIKKRIKVYKKTVQIIQNIEEDNETEWIYIKVQYTRESVSIYFLELIEKHRLLSRLLP